MSAVQHNSGLEFTMQLEMVRSLTLTEVTMVVV